MKTNEAQFYEVLENLFIGVKIEDQQESLLNPNAKALKNGMINLMKAKSQYYQSKKQELKNSLIVNAKTTTISKKNCLTNSIAFSSVISALMEGFISTTRPFMTAFIPKAVMKNAPLKRIPLYFIKPKIFTM